MRAMWLEHPESPGVKVLVVRGFWARQFRNPYTATWDEVDTYYAFRKALWQRELER